MSVYGLIFYFVQNCKYLVIRIVTIALKTVGA